jgi:hypothetical protein
MVTYAERTDIDPRERARYEAVETGQAPIALARLWLGVVLAPGAWVLGELVGYYLAARSCEPGPAGIPLPGAANPVAAHVALETVAAIVAAIGLAIALSNWRRLRRDCKPDDPRAVGRARFMASSGTIISAIFLFGILLFGISGLVVNPCIQAR